MAGKSFAISFGEIWVRASSRRFYLSPDAAALQRDSTTVEGPAPPVEVARFSPPWPSGRMRKCSEQRVLPELLLERPWYGRCGFAGQHPGGVRSGSDVDDAPHPLVDEDGGDDRRPG